MARALRHEDLHFLTRAPLRQVRRRRVALRADRVFEVLAERPQGWPAWFSLARACRYEGAPPYGVGTIRVLSLRGGIRARERLLAWDDDQRLAYRVEDVNVPGLRAFMEDWTVTPVAEDRSDVRWTLAVDCAQPVGLLLRVRRPLDHAFREATRNMAAST
jgi:Polyketide cyclase / dehydrase and lipid transport